MIMEILIRVVMELAPPVKLSVIKLSEISMNIGILENLGEVYQFQMWAGFHKRTSLLKNVLHCLSIHSVLSLINIFL